MEMFQNLQTEATMIIDSIISLSYWMRGSIPYEEMMRRTRGERQRIQKFIDSRLEAESKSPFPNY